MKDKDSLGRTLTPGQKDARASGFTRRARRKENAVGYPIERGPKERTFEWFEKDQARRGRR